MKKLSAMLSLMLLLPLLFSCNPGKAGSEADSSNNASATLSAQSEAQSKPEESLPEINPVDEAEPYPMTFVKVNDTTYAMTTDVYGGTYKFTYVKRDWGTWNLGGIYFTPDGGSQITFVDASTDWEYVYRAGKTASEINFCGGNHGNEKMLEIKFYDGESDEELNLDDKKPVELNLLKIVEKTQIYYHQKPDEGFADVTRTYTFAGKKVFVECDYKIINDTYFNLSYTTMFPINKDYGTRIVYNLENGKTREWTTSKIGKADYTGPMDYGNAAMSVDVFGHKDPRYQFHVEIYKKADMTDGFANKERTFYWDMNVGQNKLYFSKYSMESAKLVKEGTEWNTIASWEFNFVEDAVYVEESAVESSAVSD